jgi:hypothetical protein
VPGSRSLWLDSRFLSDPEAAAAHADTEALGATTHREILIAGDRLAKISVRLAQQYYRRAAAAHSLFGPEEFRQWVALGEELASGERPCREGAIAYFGVAPAAFGARGIRTAAAWCDMGRAVNERSRRLAASFFETTRTVVGRPQALQRLAVWSEVGLRLFTEHGWKGEFLAQGYFSAAPRALLLYPPYLYPLWAGLGAALYSVERPREFFGSLPRALRKWSHEDLELHLRASLALAATSAREALVLFRDLPASLQHVAPPLRTGVLQALARAGKRLTSGAADLIPVLGALLQQVPADHRLEAIAHADRLAARVPETVAPALRALPRLYEDADAARVSEWFKVGESIAAENLRAGLAYFSLESRSSLKVLHKGSTAVTFEEVEGLLRKYIQMLSGQPVSIRTMESFSLRPALEEFPHENEVALPYRVDLFATHEENFRIYRFLAAQVAGRREFGTYQFASLDGCGDVERPDGSQLWRFLNRPDQPEHLEELFLFAEGVRVHRRLCATYAGLGDDARWVGVKLLHTWQGDGDRARLPGFLEALFALVLSGGGIERWPDSLTRSASLVVLSAVVPLFDSKATVQDSMRIALELAKAIDAAEIEAANDADATDVLFLERVSGETILDPYFEEDGGVAGDSRAVAPAPANHTDSSDRLELPLEAEEEAGPGGALPLSVEELKRLLESGARLRIGQSEGEDVEGLGLYITDLLGKVPTEQLQELRRLMGDGDPTRRRAAKGWLERSASGPSFYYDEWDYHIEDYRSRWCRLQEVSPDGDSGEFFNSTLNEYSRLIPEVRRQFQRIRPEMYRTVRGLEDGEDFDLNAAVDARVDVRARRAPSSKLYVARKREERDVATLFLLDMSASTDEPFERPASGSGRERNIRRIIDVTKEALVVMTAALEEIGDAYAIYGFSGHGRSNVEFYLVKSFSEALGPAVKGRIGGIEPKRSTRMGPALRHCVEKLAAVHCRSKHLLLLSDGFPQDYDYGQDRRSNVYGIRDTMVALREVEAAGIVPFCITVDKAGHDYLRQMCDESRYLVIEDITELPSELPKIYQRVVRA